MNTTNALDFVLTLPNQNKQQNCSQIYCEEKGLNKTSRQFVTTEVGQTTK